VHRCFTNVVADVAHAEGKTECTTSHPAHSPASGSAGQRQFCRSRLQGPNSRGCGRPVVPTGGCMIQRWPGPRIGIMHEVAERCGGLDRLHQVGLCVVRAGAQVVERPDIARLYYPARAEPAIDAPFKEKHQDAERTVLLQRPSSSQLCHGTARRSVAGRVFKASHGLGRSMTRSNHRGTTAARLPPGGGQPTKFRGFPRHS